MRKLIPLLCLLVLMATGCTEDVVRSESRAPTPAPTPVPFRDISFEVQAMSAYSITIDLSTRYRLEFDLRSDLDLNFRLIDPKGNRIGNWDRITVLNGYSHTAGSTGIYELVFDNEFSLFAPKTVDFRYRVIPPGGR